MKEKADLELCQAAASALATISAGPAATPELAPTRLAPGALRSRGCPSACVTFRFAELAKKRVQGDAGVAPVLSASGAAIEGAAAALSRLRNIERSAHAEQRAPS